MTDTSAEGFGAQLGIEAAIRAYYAAMLNPDSDIVQESLTRKCDQCKAPAGQLCVKREGFGADLAGRVIHVGRRMKP
jgi:hypothetical protein